MTKRNLRGLPDEALHDLLHQLAEARKVEDSIYTKIYEHVELILMHKEAIDNMIKEKDNERNNSVPKKEHIGDSECGGSIVTSGW